MTDSNDSVLSLFSGAGGFSYGFTKAGLKPICGAEIDKNACLTYEENIGGVCHNIDLSSISPDFFKETLGGKKPFVVIGGPPCQGFSTAGSRKHEDQRNRLIFNYLNIVKEVKPRWFIFENVEGLLTSGAGASISSLVQEFLAIGYTVRIQKLNLAGFGVPQTRKRVFIIGNCMGIDFQFPQETHSYDSGKAKKENGRPFAPTLFQAISGLGVVSSTRQLLSQYGSLDPINEFDAMMRFGNEYSFVTEHYQSIKPDDEIRFSLLKAGQTMKDLPEEYWHESFKRRAFRRVKDGTPTAKRGGAPSGIKRLQGEFQSLTITSAATREFIHPLENRPLSIRECARIQTFPDHYQFIGNASAVIQQIGNAVPPQASLTLAQCLKDIDGKFGSGVQVIKQYEQPRLLGFNLTDSSGMSPALQRTASMLRSLLYNQKELELE